jgi:glyoxylase-like metal-dependent hydrolase (beta-lactamase superfamily II)
MRMPDTIISRRSALLGATAIGVGAAAGLRVPASEAKAAFASSQVPYFYRFILDKFQVTVVSDGPLPLGEPSATMKGQTKEELAKALADNFLPSDKLILEQNVLVLNTGSKLVLFDTGMGTAKAFGPTTGRLLKSLEEAKISPAAIDDVICSHGHIDHIGGLADAKGKRYFPNANVWITKADYDFWTDESKLSGDLKLFVQHARQNLLPYKDRTKWIEDGKDVVPGVQAMVSPGHTVGHSVFLVKSGSKTLAVTADTTHHQIILTEKPRTEFSYDSDPKQAVQSRLKVFDMVASQKIPLLAYHFPWPGYGYLGKQGDGYRYYPAPMELVTVPPPKA